MKSSKTILVIEDDPFIRESIQDVLALEGYQIQTAPNGTLGIHLALESLPDLIRCDVAMPEMDGYAVLSALQQHPATATTPFIFLTARTTRADLRYGMNLGADDYLVKPCSAIELIEAITTRFERQSAIRRRSETQLKSLRDNISRLQQIVWNLISNAVKFTPVGGQVQIELEQIPHSQLAQLRVSDSGQGIAPEFLPYMFDYFRQADSTITRQFGGLGLGLM